MYLIFLFVLGAIIGSFLTSLTWRIPRAVDIKKGRSKCTKCKKVIEWYDNIPVVSFILLGGKCRKCHSKISLRYPAIELTTALAFLAVGRYFENIVANLPWARQLDWLILPYLLFITSLLIAIFVIDLENMLIPDELVFLGLLVSVILLFFVGPNPLFRNLTSGFVAAFIFLLLHLITKGKGMGLGDFKLAIFVGTVLGFKLLIPWFFLSFVIGAILASILILLGRARLKDKVAFGPFMIVSFFINLVFGQYLVIYTPPFL